MSYIDWKIVAIEREGANAIVRFSKTVRNVDEMDMREDDFFTFENAATETDEALRQRALENFHAQRKQAEADGELSPPPLGQ